MAAAPTSGAPAVPDAILALARAVERADAQGLAAAFVSLQAVLERRASFTIAFSEDGVVADGSFAAHDFAARLYRDGARTVRFSRGLTLDELSRFAAIAAPAREGEDAVTELWKAELPHVELLSVASYQMHEVAGPFVSAAVSDIAARVQAAIDPYEGVSDAAQQPPLWTAAQRAQADSREWPRLAGRAAQTLLRILEQDCAGFDRAALQESFARLADRMLERGAAQALAQALVTLGALPAGLRQFMSGWVADPARLRFAVELENGARAVAAWVALLPPASGAMLMSLYRRARDDSMRAAVAAGIVARSESCAGELTAVLREGALPLAKPLVSALSALEPPRSTELAAAAFENPDPEVAVLAIGHLARDPGAAAPLLGPGLQHPAREVRLASAVALAALQGAGERAARFFLEAIASPRFAAADDEEMAVFHRCLGRLGSTVGFMYLSSRLSLPEKKLFGRKRRTREQLLAVEGLAEEATPRSLRALDEAARRGQSKPVAEASQAAARRLRTRKRS